MPGGLGAALAVLAVLAGALAAESPLNCAEEPSYAQPPRGQPPDAVKLKDDAIVRAKDGEAVQIKAVSWFGVHDSGVSVLDSLWSGGNAAATDMPAIAFQLRAQGFNGIRLPFTFSDLRAPPKSTWAKQGCEKVTLGASAPGDGAPAAAAGQQQPPRRCSWYLPDSSSLDRYLWSVQWFVANGYYVLLEARPAPGDEARVSEAAFADAWRALWRSAACLPNFKSDLEGRVFVDPMGAPDAAGHRWEPVTLFDGSVVPGLTSLYLGVMDAIWADTPSAPLFFVNGAGQGGASTWGSGFATDKATIAVNDFSDPNPFFQALLGKPYRASVVLSPAVYGSDAPAPPAASYAPPSWPMGPSPVKVMDTTFAFLAREGYCLGADCQRFPVAVGEFASRLKGAPELGALNAFAEHLTNAGVDFGGVGTWRFWGFEPALPGAS